MALVEYRSKEPDDPHTGGASVESFRQGTLRMSRVSLETGHGPDRHQHPEEQLVYVLQGRCVVECGDESYEMGPGEASYHGPNEPHSLKATEDTVVLSFKSFPE